jgi:hypothetical protein
MTILLAMAAAAATLVSQTALAEDGKVYPGTMCQKSLGVGSYGGGEIANDSTSGSLTVECPVVRDSVYGGINDAYVRVHKATTSAFWCDLHAKSAYGTAGFLQHKSVTGTGYKTFSYASMSDYNSAHYYIWCAVPPSASSSWSNKSRIIGYRLDEN